MSRRGISAQETDRSGRPSSPPENDEFAAADYPTEHQPHRDRTLRIALLLLRAGPLLILLILIVVIAMVTPVFLTTRNIGNVLAQTAVISVLAVGQLLVIITRGIDLSVGSTLALSSVAGALVFRAHGPVVAVVAAMLGAGLAVGLFNGVLYVKGRIPHPFIVTLASLTIARGLALWLSDGRPIQGMPDFVKVVGGDSVLGWLPISSFIVARVAITV